MTDQEFIIRWERHKEKEYDKMLDKEYGHGEEFEKWTVDSETDYPCPMCLYGNKKIYLSEVNNNAPQDIKSEYEYGDLYCPNCAYGYNLEFLLESYAEFISERVLNDTKH